MLCQCSLYAPTTSYTRPERSQLDVSFFTPFFQCLFLSLKIEKSGIAVSMSRAIHGFCKSFFNRISVNIDALTNQGSTKACFFRPLRKRFPFTVKFKPNIISFVAILNFGRCPAAILFAITFVVIYAINRSPFKWALSHITKKTLKGHPIIRDCYSSCSVALVDLIFWRCASLNHRNPNLIFGSFRQTVCGLSFYCSTGIARLKNPLSFCVQKLTTFANTFFTALTATQPPLLACPFVFFGFFGFAYDSPKSEFSTS